MDKLSPNEAYKLALSVIESAAEFGEATARVDEAPAPITVTRNKDTSEYTVYYDHEGTERKLVR